MAVSSRLHLELIVNLELEVSYVPLNQMDFIYYDHISQPLWTVVQWFILKVDKNNYVLLNDPIESQQVYIIFYSF